MTLPVMPGGFHAGLLKTHVKSNEFIGNFGRTCAKTARELDSLIVKRHQQASEIAADGRPDLIGNGLRSTPVVGIAHSLHQFPIFFSDAWNLVPIGEELDLWIRNLFAWWQYDAHAGLRAGWHTRAVVGQRLPNCSTISVSPSWKSPRSSNNWNAAGRHSREAQFRQRSLGARKSRRN